MTTPRDTGNPPSLASAGLPARVRRILERTLALLSEELDHGMGRMLQEFERELFRLADVARNPGSESGYMQALRSFRLNRADLVPRFMVELESALAGVRGPGDAPPARGGEEVSFRNLSLVEDTVMDEDTVLREVASRQENRATLALHLLGQRFGVLAGAPAFDAGRLPLGPQRLCRTMRTAAVDLEINYDARLLLYRMFDRQVMAGYPQLLDRVNDLLAAEGVLPALTFVPVRARPGSAEPVAAAQPAGTARPEAAARPPAPAPKPGATLPEALRPHTAWMGEARPPAEHVDDDAAFAMLQQLLSGRRELIGKLRSEPPPPSRQQLSTPDLIDALKALQRQPSSAKGRGGVAEIKQAVLAQTRQQRGAGAGLAPEDNDTFELLGLLYGQIETEIRNDAPTSALVRELQLPLLRVALRDRAFFLHADHPARQLLNTVAESAARWMDRNELDPQLVQPMRQVVADVVERFEDDPAVFSEANSQLQEHLQVQVRKAEMLERRHVEAARGKEKLEVAKMRAAEALEQALGDQRLPKFVRALLNQAWADVLTLTLLRHGEDSENWRQELDATRRIIAACTQERPAADPELGGHVEASLGLVGYHGEEATVIAQRLTGRIDDEDDDPASRTELAVKLKARVRLGEDKAKAARPKLPPRTPTEQAHYEQLRVMPFGAWIEFVTNQQGDVVRRRLSWYSPLTDNALFVNQRGQRVDEQSLDSLSRMFASGQARLVTAQRGRLVDRAWQAAVSALRSFAGRGDGAAAAGAPA
ncbi:DUF1631 domain-containing protein [Luteimonas sp. RD2P54]|uniref:DUF1631 domain-containing protein n=1 Tax=Luteimonas endophytica TaxID=3042023 RepID=A0ABT6J9P1_9GAMM|nr:DUF1631 domain-containing protein [Luteimonas endophytica]MDH5822913.1 DUF1631 domain-containing protein [Luteimonas endophytica]